MVSDLRASGRSDEAGGRSAPCARRAEQIDYSIILDRLNQAKIVAIFRGGNIHGGNCQDSILAVGAMVRVALQSTVILGWCAPAAAVLAIVPLLHVDLPPLNSKLPVPVISPPSLMVLAEVPETVTRLVSVIVPV